MIDVSYLYGVSYLIKFIIVDVICNHNFSFNLIVGRFCMIKDSNFIDLKNELSKAVVAFEKRNEDYRLYFNNHSSFQVFKDNLNHLYCKFIDEVRDNLGGFKTDEKSQVYLEMLLHVFEILDEQNGTFPDFVATHRNVKMVSKINTKLSCIHTNPDDLTQMLAYFQYQKKVIQKSVKFIMVFHKKCKKSKFNRNNLVASWKDELKEFYPDMTRIKVHLNELTLLSEKMKYLQEERNCLSKVFQKQGKDIYSSPINLFFESRIECFKDLLIEENHKVQEEKLFLSKNSENQINHQSKSIVSNQLKWTESKTALVELIYALHSSQSINDGKDGIKKIAQLFESMFDIDLGDVYHTFSEVRSRKIEQTKFLDHLKDSLLSKMKEIDEKITL